jgi:glycogen debranching enzyme
LRTGLVAVLHNWETGSDNSPAWDAALARVPTTTSTPIRRRDTSHVDPGMRPSDVDYHRYIHLVDAYRAAGWDPERQWALAPFKVADVQTTAILARATEDLAALAGALGSDRDAAELGDLRQRLRAGLSQQWRPALGRFVSHDLIAGRDIETPTQAGFVPLLALDLDGPARTAVSAEMTRWLDDVRLGLPTVPRSSPAFEPRRYWRGPVWAIMNWLLILGLVRNRLPDLAERLRAGTLDAIERAGFAEHFDPLTGEGGGGLTFSWTAAASLVLSGLDPRRAESAR